MDILNENFDYNYAINNRLEMPHKFIHINNKPVKISLIVSNGFVLLYTTKGRIYWLLQIKAKMELPDWKIHFNIKYTDLSKAWKIISETLLYHKIQKYKNKNMKDDFFFAMKIVNIKRNKNFPDSMSGREITVYIYRYNPKLNREINEVEDINENNEEIKKKIIYYEEEEENYQFWYDFLVDVEQKLKNNKIQKKIDGCADGDLYLGYYSSLRNESYTYNPKKKEYEYPPNERGWNGSNQKVPFSRIEILKIRNSILNEKHLILNIIDYKYYIISICILLIVFIIYKIYNIYNFSN